MQDGDYEERGTIRDNEAGRRTDLEHVRMLLLDGKGMHEVIDAGISYQGCRYAQLFLGYKEKARWVPGEDWVPPVVHWYYGATGTGKSRAASAEAAERGLRVYRLTGPGNKGGRVWFQGYDGEECAIFDDYRPGWFSLDKLLGLLDGYACRVEYKGGSRQWRAKEIWITCPKDPYECYCECMEDVDQLIRRVTDAKEFT